MSIDDERPNGGRSMTPFERARLVSEALSDAARRARFSTRSKKRLLGGGFHARQGQSLFHWLGVISFWLIFVVPSATAAVYYGLIASDQYVAEFKFTVAGATPPMDGIGAITGIPAVTLIQDTQIVMNHIETRAAVESIEQKIGLRKRFTSDEIDWISRFNAGKPIEKFVRYWNSMIDTTIRMPAGIVEVKIRAFTPRDAMEVARATLQVSEELINDLNERMNRDALNSAEGEVERASQRLAKARIALERAQNEEGLLDVRRTAEGLDSLISESTSTLLKLQQEYNAQLKVVKDNAPQMQALKARIAGAQAQIDELRARVTTSSTSALNESSLSRLMIRFSELDLERQISEKLYTGALASLEAARITAERKRMYLNTFVQPSLPEEARYPRRGLMIFFVMFGSFALWGAMIGSAALIRNHMA